MEETGKRKIKWQIIAPIILAIIVVGVFLYLDYRNRPKKQPQPEEEEQSSSYKPQPISPLENPKRAIPLTFEQLAIYGCAGPHHLESATVKELDKIWEIKKDGSVTRVNLGKYRINAPFNTVFDIMKLWLYFFSEKLSDRDDQVYALESSYVSKIILIVNDYEKEVKLGGDEYMLIELDYPLGDLYPYDKAAVLEYEFIIELKCKNVRGGKCLDNEGKSLNYLNGAKIVPQIRLFARGCEEFEKDITAEAEFKY